MLSDDISRGERGRAQESQFRTLLSSASIGLSLSLSLSIGIYMCVCVRPHPPQELLLAIAKTQLNHAKALHSMGLARQAMSIADEVAQSRDIGALLQLKVSVIVYLRPVLHLTSSHPALTSQFPCMFANPSHLVMQALYRKAKCALSLDEDSTFQKSVERIRELGEQQSTSSGGAEGEISEEAETVIVDLQSFQAKMKSRGFYNSH